MTAPMPAAIGSAWDVATGPDAALPRHLAEWIDESACAPELARANVQSLQGSDVLEALAGGRLEAMGGHASQYVTAPAARLLRPLEPLAAAGGWWCSGLDPLADWRGPMAWGCFKPDAPRWDQERNRPRKYEHPLGQAARLFWLRVPAVVAARVADRFGLALPAAVAADADGSAGAFWRWWAQTPTLPLLLLEGGKKAGAALSAGLPAVAAPGIWNPAPKGADGRPALLPELAAVPLAGRPVWVLYDHSDDHKGRRDVAAAYRRVGRLLAAAGADVLAGACPGPHKGADDALAAGVPWETLAAALQPLSPDPALPRLRSPDVIAPAGQFVGAAVTIPTAARVVALACAMGCGKTEAIAAHLAPLQAAGVRVVLVTHRRSLGAALAERLGLPWGDDALPGSDLRQTGIALCIDSLCPGSRLRFNPADWRGAVVVIDEVTAVLAHAVMATGTAIADRRVPVLQALGDLIAWARQTLIADAQLDNATLQAIEAAAGERAHLIGSDNRPAAGRELVTYETRAEWYGELCAQLRARRRLWISTTAAEGTSANSAQNLAILVHQIWGDARVLVVDRDTVANPEHDAHRLAKAPDTIAAAYDVVIATPAIAAGLSVTLRDHFAAVFVAAGGTTDPGAVAQAAGRVRDGCPRHLYAPDRSPGNHLLMGCGSICPDRVMLHLQHHHHLAVGQLAAAGVNLTAGTTGPWLPLWAQLAAQRNRARLTFRDTVTGLLAAEGYAIRQAATVPDAICPKMLRELAEMEKGAEQDRVIAAEPLTDQEARQLQSRRQRLNPTERAQLQRWRIDRAWGLGQAAPTREILEAHEQGAPRRAVFWWAVTDLAAAPLIAAHDRQQAQLQAPDGRPWAPDLCADLLGPAVAVAQSLGLPAWLERGKAGDWFTTDDPALLRLHATATAHSAALTQTLGLRPGKNATTVLRQLLALTGHRLESRQIRSGLDRGRWRYRVAPMPLPAGTTAAQLVTAWREAQGRDGTEISLQR